MLDSLINKNLLSEEQIKQFHAYRAEGLIMSADKQFELTILGEVFMGHLVKGLKKEEEKKYIDDYIEEGYKIGEAISQGRLGDDNAVNNRQLADIHRFHDTKKSIKEWIYAFLLGLAEPRFRGALGKAVWRTLPFVTNSPKGKNGRSRWPLIQKMTYELMSELNTDSGMTVLNLGYAGLKTPHTISISEEDEENRFAFQLYDYLFKFSDSAGKDVLDVGCGRGGGAKFIFKTYCPNSYLGVDFAKANIAFCNRVHSENGLSFKVGRAECLDLPDSSFDTVINIESSHCYTSPDLFFKEVQRVLKPGGMFLFADIRGEGVAEEYQIISTLNAQLNELTDMAFVTRTNITKNVMRALELSGENQVERWTRIIRQNLNRSSKSQRFFEHIIEPELCSIFSPQASSPDCWYHLFKSGKAEYWAYILRKNW